MEILAVGAALIQAERRKDGRKDMTKMICAFSDYGNALKNELLYRILSVIYEKLCLFVTVQTAIYLAVLQHAY